MLEPIRYLKYGILAILASATIGTSLWFERPDNKILAQDMIELKQGIIERMLATQYKAKEVNTWMPVIQYYEPYKTGESDKQYFITVGTNAVAKNYNTIGARYSGETSNFNWYLKDVFINPFWLTGSVKVYDYTNRFIVGTYSNINVSGMIDDYAGLNGNYYYQYQINEYNYQVETDTKWLVYKKASGNNRLICNKDFTYIWNADYGGDYPYYNNNVWQKQFVPWVSHFATYDSGYGEPITNYNIVCTPQNLITNKIVDAPLWTETPWNGQFLGNNLNKYQDDLGIIDGLLLGVVSISYYTAPTCMVSALLYPPCYFPAMDREQYGGSQPFYIDPTAFNVSQFANKYELQIDRVGLWSSMGATNKQWYFNSLEYVAFDDMKIVPFSFIEQRMKAVQNKNALSKKMLSQRYQAIKSLNTMFSGGGISGSDKTLRWVAAYPDNATHFQGRGLTIQECLDNLVEARGSPSTSDGAPYSMACLFNRGGSYGYILDVYQKASKLENPYIWNDAQSACAFYAKAGFPNAFPNASNNNTYTHAVFSDNGESVSQTQFKKFDFQASSLRNNAISSGYYGSSDPKELVPNMTLPDRGKYEWKGFQIVDEAVMLQWAFEYCIR